VQTGLEFSGVIESDGLIFKKSDRVFGYVHMITGWKSHAEYLAIDEDYLALMPDTLSFSEAAAIPLGALTTLVALQDVVIASTYSTSGRNSTAMSDNSA
jgi:NADPH:quinone reductase-like Zn-dependent oxidoreductase